MRLVSWSSECSSRQSFGVRRQPVASAIDYLHGSDQIFGSAVGCAPRSWPNNRRLRCPMPPLNLLATQRNRRLPSRSSPRPAVRRRRRQRRRRRRSRARCSSNRLPMCHRRRRQPRNLLLRRGAAELARTALAAAKLSRAGSPVKIAIRWIGADEVYQGARRGVRVRASAGVLQAPRVPALLPRSRSAINADGDDDAELLADVVLATSENFMVGHSEQAGNQLAAVAAPPPLSLQATQERWQQERWSRAGGRACACGGEAVTAARVPVTAN